MDEPAADRVRLRAQREERSAAAVLVEEGLLVMPVVAALQRELGQDVAIAAIAGFRILRPLGHGGMGTVYLAEQVSLRRQVALKVVAPQFATDATAVDRFLREARTAAALNHPNIISVIDVGYDQGQLYMALELVSGGDAAQLASRFDGVLPEVRALEIASDCCHGLQALFEARLVHRDIKPANIFITAEGVAKLADLGLARSEQGDDRVTVSGHALGTPAFMSPEQADGSSAIDIRSDLYSLGAALFALTTGSPPFSGNGAYAIAVKLLTEPAPDPRTRNPRLSEATSRIILRCLAKRPQERFQTPFEMSTALAQALRLIAQGPPGSVTSSQVESLCAPSPPVTAVPRRPRPHPTRRGRRGVAWIPLGLSITLLLSAGAWLLARPTAATRAQPALVAATPRAEVRSLATPTVPASRAVLPTAPTAGLVAYWPFDEGSGNRVQDRSGSGAEGTFSGCTWGAGWIGQGALEFAPPSLVRCRDTPRLAPEGISVTCWIKTSVRASGQEPISVIRHDGHFTALQLLPDGTAHAVTWVGGHVNHAAFAWDGVWNDDHWHHFAVTYHARQGFQLFKDGKLVKSLPEMNGSLLPPQAPFVMGGSELECEYFRGALDEVRVYERVLLAAEVTALATR